MEPRRRSKRAKPQADRRRRLEAILRVAWPSMSERDAFGPNLRRVRVQRGISLEEIARATKVSVHLWAGLERGNLSRWPTGIYARSYVRAYASHIGADPEGTVDEFCRWFPHGDRRAAPVVPEQAAEAEPSQRPPVASRPTRRTAAAIADIVAVALAAGVMGALTRVGWSVCLASCAIAYHASALIALGRTPAGWALTSLSSAAILRTRSQGPESPSACSADRSGSD